MSAEHPAATTDSLEARREARTWRQMFRGELPQDRTKVAEPIPLRVACGKCLDYVVARKDGSPRAHDCPGKPLPKINGRVIT